MRSGPTTALGALLTLSGAAGWAETWTAQRRPYRPSAAAVAASRRISWRSSGLSGSPEASLATKSKRLGSWPVRGCYSPEEPTQQTSRPPMVLARLSAVLLTVLAVLFHAPDVGIAMDDDGIVGSPPSVPSRSRSRPAAARRYWSALERGAPADRRAANAALLDYAVGTVNTMYYDPTGGAAFQPRDFDDRYRSWLRSADGDRGLADRAATVRELKALVASLRDPFSQYLTPEELRAEQAGHWNFGFLGLGAVVEPPSRAWYVQSTPVIANLPPPPPATTTAHRRPDTRLAVHKVLALPVVTAVAPDSPAERAGLTVGDRIVAVGQDVFLGRTEPQLAWHLEEHYSAENYLGYPSLTVAKPVYAAVQLEGGAPERDVVVAYRATHVRLPTATVEPFRLSPWAKGDASVHYELLSSEDSIFAPQRVGYIRLTRFSRAATAGFVRAVEDLDASGAASFIIDLRNNYGGVLQEAMLTASALLRDPHAVLCYTMNSRGGFTPHDVEEYVVDARYPGYLLSAEPQDVVRVQVRRENPSMFASGTPNWVPPSSYASLHEQGVKRGIHLLRSDAGDDGPRGGAEAWRERSRRRPVVVLVNEGTASSAEVFAAALRDNGRARALVGTKTYGKGLIQHLFPLPDGGALKLTVAEYLTPALRHVTHVGGAQYVMGERVGGGLRPDVACESRQGIPGNVGADLCVGVALDVLEEAGEARYL